MDYNRQEFNLLLLKAMDGRSQNKFAATTGVSVAYISRLLKGEGKSAPSPDIIYKFASGARNGVTYDDFMRAAGHITDPNNVSSSDKAFGQPSAWSELSFLGEEIFEWVRNPENAEFIRFIYRANKKGLTKDLLHISQFLVNFGR